MVVVKVGSAVGVAEGVKVTLGLGVTVGEGDMLEVSVEDWVGLGDAVRGHTCVATTSKTRGMHEEDQ